VGAACVPPDALVALARAGGWDAVEAVDDPVRAVSRALERAARLEPPGEVLVTGSLKLGAAVRAALRERGDVDGR
jgi:predicted NBD/HSP70 family sugar kinase